ncbi:MAG: efflux transporter periplasmic adaptor subunit, partial [Gammaproteobacteria bacterium]|nr:efflux transporter periplasmic adaptor subunit [Gammaproteobacteria bacterium]
MRWKKSIFTLLAGLALIVALVWAFLPQPVPVEVTEITRGRFEQIIEEDGKTRVRERYVVSAPLAGELQRIRFKAGDPVTAGMTLAVIDPGAPALLDVRSERELTERLGAAEAARLRAAAAVERARAALDKSRADLERTRKLAEKGFVSASQLEQAELETKTNTRELEAAKYAGQAAAHDVAMARAALLHGRGGAAGRPSGRRWEVRTPVS